MWVRTESKQKKQNSHKFSCRNKTNNTRLPHVLWDGHRPAFTLDTHWECISLNCRWCGPKVSGPKVSGDQSRPPRAHSHPPLPQSCPCWAQRCPDTFGPPPDGPWPSASGPKVSGHLWSTTGWPWAIRLLSRTCPDTFGPYPSANVPKLSGWLVDLFITNIKKCCKIGVLKPCWKSTGKKTTVSVDGRKSLKEDFGKVEMECLTNESFPRTVRYSYFYNVPLWACMGIGLAWNLPCDSRMWYWCPTTCTPPGVYRLAMEGVLVEEGVTNLTSVTTHTSCVPRKASPLNFLNLNGLKGVYVESHSLCDCHHVWYLKSESERAYPSCCLGLSRLSRAFL